MFRKIIFWTHLVTGVVSALVVLTMSFTGVMLTYERQILAWQARGYYVPTEEQTTALPLDQMLRIASNENPEQPLSSLVVTNDPGAPVALRAGRSGGVNLNPYTGEEMAEAPPALDNFFGTMTSFHRWFSLTGDNRNIARAITGACNLMFLFLVLSGMYLWLPALWQWRRFKTRLWFDSRVSSSKARNFNWHHVFGIWTKNISFGVVCKEETMKFLIPTEFTAAKIGMKTGRAKWLVLTQVAGEKKGCGVLSTTQLILHFITTFM
ncbi:MAG: hypothetical protein COA96_16565 [SAR86 cluster bacterium]|uniref:PepSY domain-containing protein n=1 Tax=SAR86 cluster bacterium TaxID=2030880 RepID=A0A2A5AHF1_9GAMM|nr:MAG: hypothetical protein COA96_16565 [SAR86 cluster bacterium]